MKKKPFTRQFDQYLLSEYASVHTYSEFLTHLQLKQNVVYVDMLSNLNNMSAIKTNANFKSIISGNGPWYDFYYTFEIIPATTLSVVFKIAITEIEKNNALPVNLNSAALFTLTYLNTEYNIKVWKDYFNGVYNPPTFLIEIY